MEQVADEPEKENLGKVIGKLCVAFASFAVSEAHGGIPLVHRDPGPVFSAEVTNVSGVVDIPVSKDHQRKVAWSAAGSIEGFSECSTLEGKTGIDQHKPGVPLQKVTVGALSKSDSQVSRHFLPLRGFERYAR
jgi:hypothetical protein